MSGHEGQFLLANRLFHLARCCTANEADPIIRDRIGTSVRFCTFFVRFSFTSPVQIVQEHTHHTNRDRLEASLSGDRDRPLLDDLGLPLPSRERLLSRSMISWTE